jgi:RNA polymerase sigma factor (sigma-70 family)
MVDETDRALIRAYVRRRCEQSFAELVRRHVNLVHSTALRIVRDAALAGEVTQGVFLALARHAARLGRRSSLTGWLYETTRNLSINAVRSEARRRQREGEAATMKTLIVDESQTTWDQLAPHLEEAMAQLKRGEREVILWRYFERKTAQEIGVRLGLGPAAAQKRVSRAVDRLRGIFAKRGLTITGASLAAILSADAVKAAPASLAVAAIAAANGLSGSLTTTSIIQLLMTSTQVKIGVAALVAASITTPIVLQHLANQRLKEEVVVLRQQTAETAKLREDGERLRAVAKSAESERDKEQTELARLRGELVALRAREAEAEAVSKAKASTKAESQTADAAQESAGQLLLAKDLRNVGFADPESAYQTLQWAKVNGDTNVIYHALAWGDERTRAQVEAAFAAAPEAVKAKYGSADEFILHLLDRSQPHEDRDILVSSRILQENDVSGDEKTMQVEWNWADGSTTTGPMTFVRMGNDWRQALNFDPPAVGKMNTGLQTEGAALANQTGSK